MSKLEQPILVSFKLCPFVQRAVITLNHKKIEHTIEYIDLNKKPDWLLSVSPLGKVPLMRVGENVLFESAVINEYLDETYGESMLPSEPLTKAKHRAWIEFSSSLNNAQYQLTQARREQTFRQIQSDLAKKLSHLEQQVEPNGFFAGDKLGLVDISFAPFLMRSQILADETGEDSLEDFKKLSKWRENILSIEAVQKSVVSDFEELYNEALYERDGYLVELAH